MTRVDDQVAHWMFSDTWGIPAEANVALSDEENLQYGKALILAASADGQLSEKERGWILGYVATGGHSSDTVAKLREYSGGDDFESLFELGMQKVAQRVCIYDAIRACGADGDVAAQELAAIKKMALKLGLTEQLVDEFKAIYDAEQALRAKRISLVFPSGLA